SLGSTPTACAILPTMPIVKMSGKEAQAAMTSIFVRSLEDIATSLVQSRLWGGQSWPQPPFRRLDSLESESAGRVARPTSASASHAPQCKHLPSQLGRCLQ